MLLFAAIFSCKQNNLRNKKNEKLVLPSFAPFDFDSTRHIFFNTGAYFGNHFVDVFEKK